MSDPYSDEKIVDNIGKSFELARNANRVSLLLLLLVLVITPFHLREHFTRHEASEIEGFRSTLNLVSEGTLTFRSFVDRLHRDGYPVAKYIDNNNIARETSPNLSKADQFLLGLVGNSLEAFQGNHHCDIYGAEAYFKAKLDSIPALSQTDVRTLFAFLILSKMKIYADDHARFNDELSRGIRALVVVLYELRESEISSSVYGLMLLPKDFDVQEARRAAIGSVLTQEYADGLVREHARVADLQERLKQEQSTFTLPVIDIGLIPRYIYWVIPLVTIGLGFNIYFLAAHSRALANKLDPAVTGRVLPYVAPWMVALLRRGTPSLLFACYLPFITTAVSTACYTAPWWLSLFGIPGVHFAGFTSAEMLGGYLSLAVTMTLYLLGIGVHSRLTSLDENVPAQEQLWRVALFMDRKKTTKATAVPDTPPKSA